MVIEHNNNGKKWTSVYWHLQNKGLIKTKKSVCDDRISGIVRKECKVTKNTILGYIDKTTDMNDVNHLHLGIRPKPYLKDISQLGFAIGKELNNFENPLNFLPRKAYALLDDSKTNAKYMKGWTKSNTLDMYSGTGYIETSKSFGDSVSKPFYGTTRKSAKYKVYAKFPVSSNRTEKAYYLIIIKDKNKKLDYSIKKINQSDLKNRGHNVFLFEKQINKDDIIIVYIFNGDKTGKFMSSDALLFIRE
jgi:hypothetical protein